MDTIQPWNTHALADSQLESAQFSCEIDPQSEPYSLSQACLTASNTFDAW